MTQIVLTRELESNLRFKNIIESKLDLTNIKKGKVEILNLPCLSFTEPSDNFESLDIGIKRNNNFLWLFFFSIRAAESYFDRLLALGGNLFNLAPHLKIAVIGKKTANFLEHTIGFPVDFCPSEANMEIFTKEFLMQHTTESNYLDPITAFIPRSEIGDPNNLKYLEDSNRIKLTVAKAYNNIKASWQKQQNEIKKLEIENDLIVSFTSNSSINYFLENIAAYNFHNILNKLTCCCIGKTTFQHCHAKIPNANKIEISEEANIDSLADLILNNLRGKTINH